MFRVRDGAVEKISAKVESAKVESKKVESKKVQSKKVESAPSERADGYAKYSYACKARDTFDIEASKLMPLSTKGYV